MHDQPFEGCGRTYDVNGHQYLAEDWWDRVVGESWMDCDGNPAALKYAVRSAVDNLPFDNEVLYGKIDGLGHIIHVTELH